MSSSLVVSPRFNLLAPRRSIIFILILAAESSQVEGISALIFLYFDNDNSYDDHQYDLMMIITVLITMVMMMKLIKMATMKLKRVV